MLTSAEIEQRPATRISTHVNDPLPAAVGNTVLCWSATASTCAPGSSATDSAAGWTSSRAAVIGDIRGRGLLVGVDWSRRTQSAMSSTGSPSPAGGELGLHMNIVQLGMRFRIAPPLTTSDADIDHR